GKGPEKVPGDDNRQHEHQQDQRREKDDRLALAIQGAPSGSVVTRGSKVRLPKSRVRIWSRPSTLAISLNAKNGSSSTKQVKPTPSRPLGFHPSIGGTLSARVLPCHIPTATLSTT